MFSRDKAASRNLFNFMSNSFMGGYSDGVDIFGKDENMYDTSYMDFGGKTDITSVIMKMMERQMQNTMDTMWSESKINGFI